MKTTLIGLLLIAGCYAGPAKFHEIGENYVRDVHDCSDMSWEWIDHLIATGTDPDDLRYMSGERMTKIFDDRLRTGQYHAWVARWDGGVWVYDDPMKGWYGMEKWIYDQEFGPRTSLPVRQTP